MAGVIKKVSAGDPLEIPASAYNAFVDAADAESNFKKTRPTDVGTDLVLGAGQIWGEIDQQATYKKFQIVTVSGFAVPPGDNLGEFKSRSILKLAAPDVDTDPVIVILGDNGRKGDIVRATLFGVTPVRLNVTDVDHTSAKLSVSGSFNLVKSQLDTTSDGPARIMWKESGTGPRWGVVALSGSARPSTIIPVTMLKISGSPGTASAGSTFRYRVTSLSGQVILEDINPTTSPHRWRRSRGLIVQANFGIAHIEDDEVVVGWCNEVAVHQVCLA